MSKNNISIVGNFAHGAKEFNGQTIKTKILSGELKRQLKNYSISEIDTYNYKKHPFRLICGLMKAFLKSDNIIILLSRNGRKVLFPLFYYMNKIFHRHIWHNVIGAASYELVLQNPSWVKYMNSFDASWVELKKLDKNLKSVGINNVSVIPNFKKLNIVLEDDLKDITKKPFKFCTFSRVEPQKGIEEAVEAIKNINDESGDVIATLDIYGQIEAGQKEWFKKLKESFPDYIKYNGIVEYEKSVETLKNYYMLLFPSKYETEGFPGTLIDAFASGLPVIASMDCELITNDETGWTYSGCEKDDLKRLILKSIKSYEEINAMRKNCIAEAKKYQPEIVVKDIISEMKLNG